MQRKPAAFERVGSRQADDKGGGGVEGDADGRHQEDEEQILVPQGVIEEATQSARAEPTWIVRQGNGHIVVVEEGPGSPDTATGDIGYIAEFAPRSV